MNDSEEISQMEEAIKSHNTPELQALLQNTKSPKEDLVFLPILAIEKNNSEALKLLLKAGITPNPEIKESLLRHAISEKNKEVINLLHKTFPYEESNGGLLLQSLAQSNQQEEIKTLLEKGNISRTDICQANQVATQNGHLEVLQLIRKKRPDAFEVSTLLEEACESNQRNCILYLVQEKEILPTQKIKALATIGETEEIQRILETNSIPKIYIQRAMQLAVQKGHLETLQFLESQNTKPDFDDHICLRIATYQGHQDITNYLLDKKADPKAGNHEALTHACVYDHKKIRERLLTYYSTPELKTLLEKTNRDEVKNCLTEEISRRHAKTLLHSRTTQPELEP